MRKLVVFVTVLVFLFFNLSAQKQKIIFDCDLGGAIDNAFAVVLLLSSPEEFEIPGLCMDHRNTKIDSNKKPNCTIGVTINDEVFLHQMSRRIITQNSKRN